MRKIMIAILLIIPIIVIFSINVSGLIISAEISINIESMTLTHRGEEVFAEQINLEEYTEANKKYQLFANYYPKIAQNKSIIWSSSDERIATVHNGIVTFIDYGKVDITATAASNTSCTATCTFYIVGEKISKISLKEFHSDISSKEFLFKKYEKRQLNAEITPITALGKNKIDWTSQDKSIVTVDKNGVITAVGYGSAEVIIKAKGIKGEELTKTITVKVEGVMLSQSDIVFTSSGSYDFANIITSEDVQVYIDKKLVISKKYEIGNQDTVDVELRRDGEKQIIKLVRKATDKALVIENLSTMQKGRWSVKNYLAQGGADTQLKVIAAEGVLSSNANIIWSSNDENVVTVLNGRLFATRAGEAIVTASCDGYESVSLDVIVAMPINYITLEYNQREDKAGLAEDRVFGIYSYSDGELNNQLKINISSTSPNVLNTQDHELLFNFYSSNEEYATVDNEGIISFSRAGINKTVTITVEPQFSPLNAKASYTFKLIDGINVGVGYKDNKYDKENDIMPSFQPFYDIAYIANTYQDDLELYSTVSAIVLHTNIYYPISTSYNTIAFSRSIYGNGYKLDGQFQASSFTTRMFHSHINGLFNPQRPLDIIIENLAVQSYAPISEDSQTAFRELADRGGLPYYKCSTQDIYKDIRHVFRYCLFQYAYGHFDISAGYTMFEGCIFRNTAGPAILMQSGPNYAADLTLKNCIFSNSVAPAVISTCGVFMSDKNSRGDTKFPTFRLEGESYIYNWKLLDDNFKVDVIPTSNVSETYMPLYEALNSNIAEWFKFAFKDERNQQSVYKTVKGDHVNLGIVMIPLWVANNTKLNPQEDYIYTKGIAVIGDESKYKLDDIYVDTGIANNMLIKEFIRQKGIRLTDSPMNLLLPKGDKEGYNTLPDEKYELNAITIAKLHGR